MWERKSARYFYFNPLYLKLLPNEDKSIAHFKNKL